MSACRRLLLRCFVCWLKHLCSLSHPSVNITFHFCVSSKKRKPAWTDRILWRLRPKDASQEKRVDADIRKVKQVEEDEEYPLKIRQDLYTSNMEYSISDHKPVIGVFTLEVRNTFIPTTGSDIFWPPGALLKHLIFCDLVYLFVHLCSCLSSWGRCTRHLWCSSNQRETGAQTLMPWWSTVLCSLSKLAHGTGSDSTRSVIHSLLHKTRNGIYYPLNSRLDSPAC